MRVTMRDRALGAARLLLITLVAAPLAASCQVEELLRSAGEPAPGSPPPVTPASPLSPRSLGQFRGDSSTPVSPGATLTEPRVVIAALVDDPQQDDQLKLQVEMRYAGSAFTGAATHVSAAVAPGSRALVDVTLSQSDTGYIWQARTIDRAGNISAWVAFEAGSAAFRIASPPSLPTDLEQLEADGSTQIPVGGTTAERDVFLRATAPAGGGGRLEMQFEVRSRSNPLRGEPTHSDDDVRPGERGSVKFRASAFTGYHWQVRTCAGPVCGGWVEFGGNDAGEFDFYRDPFSGDDDVLLRREALRR